MKQTPQNADASWKPWIHKLFWLGVVVGLVWLDQSWAEQLERERAFLESCQSTASVRVPATPSGTLVRYHVREQTRDERVTGVVEATTPDGVTTRTPFRCTKFPGGVQVSYPGEDASEDMAHP